MDSQQWEDLVVEGRRLVETSPRDRWALGDLALMAVQPGRTRDEKSASQKRLADFAEAIGADFSLIKDCWYTSAAWPIGGRFPGVSHSKHSRYRSRPNRVDLLLNDEMDDGLTSERVRDKVHRAEELLQDKAVRSALMDRSTQRSRRISVAARAIDNEEDLKARAWARAKQEQAKADLLGPGIRAAMAERFIKANGSLARMVAELIDLRQVVNQVPDAYRERTTSSLHQVLQAAERVLHELQPDLREPQPRTVIDHDDLIGGRASEVG